jgi:iron-sulfur cluster repair protein YtfE (RIC family)
MSSTGAGVGDLVVKIGADISGLRRDVSSAAKSLGSLESATGSLGTALKAVGAAVAAAGLVHLVKEQLQAIDATAKLARQLGGTVDGVRTLQQAASDAGVDSGALSSAMEKLNQRLGEAARTGSGKTHEALKLLKLDAEDLSRMDVDQRMAAIADRMKDMGLSTQQAADILRQMGIRQGSVVNLMLQGGDAVREWRKEIEELGLALSDVDAAKVEAANDAMAKIGLVTEAVIQRFTVGLAPALEVIATEFTDLWKGVDDFEGAVDTAVAVVIKGLGFAGDIVMGLEFGFRGLELAAALAFGGMIGQLEGVAHAVELVTGKQFGWTQEIHSWGEAARAGVTDVVGELDALSAKEWPSSKAERMIEAIRNRAIEAKKEIGNLAGSGGGDDKKKDEGPTGFDFGGEEGAALGVGDAIQRMIDELAAKEALEKESLERQLEQLRQFSLSAEQIEMERYAKQAEHMSQAFEAGLINAESANAVMEKLEAKHMDALAKIRQEGMDQVQEVSVDSMAQGAQQILGMARQLTAGMDQNSREMFEINKAFSIVDALISGARGVAQTMGSYPFPYNIPLAVAHAGMAAAQVGIISAQQFSGSKSGGGGSVMAPSARGASAGPSMGRGGGTGPQHGGESGGSQLLQINLQGDTFSRNTVIALMEQMNELTADGVRIAVR